MTNSRKDWEGRRRWVDVDAEVEGSGDMRGRRVDWKERDVDSSCSRSASCSYFRIRFRNAERSLSEGRAQVDEVSRMLLDLDGDC